MCYSSGWQAFETKSSVNITIRKQNSKYLKILHFLKRQNTIDLTKKKKTYTAVTLVIGNGPLKFKPKFLQKLGWFLTRTRKYNANRKVNFLRKWGWALKEEPGPQRERIWYSTLTVRALQVQLTYSMNSFMALQFVYCYKCLITACISAPV